MKLELITLIEYYNSMMCRRGMYAALLFETQIIACGPLPQTGVDDGGGIGGDHTVSTTDDGPTTGISTGDTGDQATSFDSGDESDSSSGCGPQVGDEDEDGVLDCIDNCVSLANADQSDIDADGVGDACDVCINHPNADQADDDGDGVGNICDNCRQIPNADQDGGMGDGTGDACACAPLLRPCDGGMAGDFACDNIELVSHLDLATLGVSAVTDLWGWDDLSSDRQFVLVAASTGTVFVEVTHPYCPLVLGVLPSAAGEAWVRDIKVYENYAFVVGEAAGHGMQVFDLRQLLDVANPPLIFEAEARYQGFGRAHNLTINAETGFAYAVMVSSCEQGLYMMDVRDPMQPQFVGCQVPLESEVPDAQCIKYEGLDSENFGREICLTADGFSGSISIFDVTQKDRPRSLANVTYPGAAYTYQVWVTDDHRYMLTSDELDELNQGTQTRTFLWSLDNLELPELIGAFEHSTYATDHNIHTRGSYAYVANYHAGIQVLDLSAIEGGQVSKVGSFDTFPSDDLPGLNGAFSSFPYLPDGLVAITDIEGGLFIVRHGNGQNGK